MMPLALLILFTFAIQAQTFSTNPSSGQQLTTVFSYSGSGLTPNGQIQQWFQAPNGSLQSFLVNANSSGQLSWTYVYKCTDAIGTWQNWIVDVSKNWTSPHLPNTVTAHPNCTTPAFTGSPTSGQQLTTTFTYSGTGLTPNGTIQQKFQAPNGGVQTFTATADVNGNLNWTYVYKCTDAVGTWQNWIVDLGRNWTSPQVPNTVTAHPSCSTPTISSITPTTPVASADDQTVTVSGTGFQSGLTVTAYLPGGGTGLLQGSQIQNVTSNSFQLIIKLGNPGSWGIQVNQSSQTSNRWNFTVASSPHINNITPTSVSPSTFNLTINGTGFDLGAIDRIYFGSNLVGSGAIQSRTGTQIVVQENLSTATPGTYTVKVRNSDGTESNGVSLTITSAGPSISGISPGTPTASADDQTVTVSGSGFQSGLTVTAFLPGGGTSLLQGSGQIQNVTATSFQMVIKLGGPGSWGIQVNQSGQTSNRWNFTVASSPHINNITPTSVSPSTFNLTINGTGFDLGSIDRVYFGSNLVGSGAIQSRTGTQIVVQENLSTATPGTYTVKVRNSDGTESNGVSLTVTSPGPSISGISPGTPNASADDQTVTVSGGGFQSGLTVTAFLPGGGTSLLQGSGQIQNVTPNSFQMVIKLGGPGSWGIQVNQSGQTSNRWNFTVASSPNISNITPTSASPSTFNLTINGTGFDVGAIDRIYFGNNLVGSGTIQSRTGTQIVVQENLSTATPGTYTVKVRNSDGTESNGVSLTVASPGPSISGISPGTPMASADDQTVTVSGSGFQSGLTVTAFLPGGGTSLLQGSGQIQNVTASSFQTVIKLGGPGSWGIQVNQSGQTSNRWNFTVASSPNISNATPTSVSPSTFNLTINGTGFDLGAIDRVYFGNNLVGSGAIQSRTGTQIVVQENLSTATPGTYTVKVRNSDGTESNGVSLTVTSTPSLNIEVSPSSAQTYNLGDTLTFTITVRDSNSNPVAGANVAIQDGLQGGALQNFATNGSGMVAYSYVIPTNLASPGTYTLTFGPATKSGYTQSGTVTRQVTVNSNSNQLSLDVQPSTTQTATPGSIVTYSITVRDSSNNGISGATVPVTNPLAGNATLTTVSGGTASYSFTVPSGTSSGQHTISFGTAHKTGYVDSAIVQRTVAVNGPQPFLTLDVTPAAIQSVNAGQTVNYSLSVRDGNGAGVGSATVTVTNPFTGTNSTVMSDGSGNANYSLSVPSNQGSGTFTVFFSGASKSGYTSSNGMSRQVTVLPGSGGTHSGTLTSNPTTCQVQTVGGRCTITLTWTTQNVSAAQIWVLPAVGPDTPVATGLQGSQSIPWIEASPQTYTFRLWDYSSGSRGAKLAEVLVIASPPSGTQTTPSVRVDPATGPKGTTFSILGSNLASGAATLFVKLPSGTTTTAAQLTIPGSGSFTFNYASSQSSAVGVYEAWTVDSASKRSTSGYFTINTPTTSSVNGPCGGNSGCSGDPINTATGNYGYQHADLTIAGRGIPFVFGRSYNSLDTTPGPMGNGWTHSFQGSLVKNSDSSVTIRLPDGRVIIFDSVGGAYRPRFSNVYSTLTAYSSDSFLLTNKAAISYQFFMGKLSAIDDRNGHLINLSYDSNNRLTTIVDTVGRAISLAYDAAGHLTSVTDPLGRTLRYEYDSAGNQTAFTDARGGRFRYSYDSSNRMLTAIDPENNTFLTNEYDGSGRVTAQSDGAANRWTYSYNDTNFTTTITDPNAKITTHQHNSNFELLSVTDTFGKSETYQYSNGNRTSLTNRNNNTTRYSYDGSGNVISVVDPQSKVQTASYNAMNDPVTRTDVLGNTSVFSYDTMGNLTTARDAAGNSATYTYDSLAQPVTKTDAEGRITRYRYDSSGNMIEETDPLGNKTTHTYDGVGRRISTTDANQFATTFAYDSNDNLTSVTDPLGNKIQYAYDGNNNRIRVTDQRGKITTTTYNANYQVASVTDALGNRTTNTYDRLRNLASTTDALGKVTRYAYDSENRLTSITDPLSNVTRYEYDANGNRTKVTDPLGNATTHAYDSLNRLISVTDALGNTTSNAYDDAGRLTRKTDPAGNSTSYSYDSLGRQTGITDAAGGTVTFAYDRAGNRTSITDTRGKTTRFTYDNLNRLLTTSDPLGNTTSNRYDSVGNLQQVTDGNGNSKTFEYDANRRQTKVIYSTGGNIQFQYDAAGNRTKMIDLIGTSTYTHDDLNRLQTYASPFGAGLSFAYDSVSNRTGLTYPGSKTVQYTFDANSRITKVRAWNGFEANYTYDGAGRTTAVTYSNGLSTAFTYDTVGQNTRIEHKKGSTVLYSEATSWSANGNPTSSDISGLNSTGFIAENSSFTFDDANRLATTPAGSPAHDRNGNLVSMPGAAGTTSFTYDLNNRATRIIGASTNATLSYLGDGKLATLNSSRFLLDPTVPGNRILAELDTAGAVQTAYVHGPRGMLFQIMTAESYTYHHNLQMSTALMTDSSGVARNTYRYDPFGKKLGASTEQISNMFSFLGSFSVPSIGQFVLTHHRLYDSREARFTSSDPLAMKFPQWAAYVYANQSPLALLDASGLNAVPAPTSTAGGIISPLFISGSTPGTAGSTPASLLNATILSTSSASGSFPLDKTDLAGMITGVLTEWGKKLAPAGYELIPDGAGAWRFVRHDVFGKLETAGQIVDIVDLVGTLATDIKNGTATLGSIWKATGKAAGCAVLNAETLGLGCPVFQVSKWGGDQLFAPGKPLSPVIEGGSVGGVYVPGLGDFTKDVVLDFPQNTKTVWNLTKSGATAAGNWIGQKWSSLW
ncbi:MAG: hypothetical protein IT165_06240 [Bryobacterales bacterium]|nr:hypothetical protein [Bryobacterales bacterium]